MKEEESVRREECLADEDLFCHQGGKTEFRSWYPGDKVDLVMSKGWKSTRRMARRWS